jgi:hypothetical protein
MAIIASDGRLTGSGSRVAADYSQKDLDRQVTTCL